MFQFSIFILSKCEIQAKVLVQRLSYNNSCSVVKYYPVVVLLEIKISLLKYIIKLLCAVV